MRDNWAKDQPRSSLFLWNTTLFFPHSLLNISYEFYLLYFFFFLLLICLLFDSLELLLLISWLLNILLNVRKAAFALTAQILMNKHKPKHFVASSARTQRVLWTGLRSVIKQLVWSPNLCASISVYRYTVDLKYFWLHISECLSLKCSMYWICGDTFRQMF